MRVAGTARERDLRTLSAAIGLSALGDGVALVALALQAKNLTGEGMGGGIAIAAMFICLWAPVVLLSGYAGLLVDRLETRRLLVVVSAAQAAVAAALALVGSLGGRCSRSRSRSEPGSRSRRRPSSHSSRSSRATGSSNARTGSSRRRGRSASRSGRSAAACSSRSAARPRLWPSTPSRSSSSRSPGCRSR